ncbi:MAG TPA: hypothetical protein VJB57_16650 [Dehalococcoidia bacterium]|nr:hypothetical protein [Dehalococcoidia bacterium]
MNRELTSQERALLLWALDAKGGQERYLEQVESLRVIGGCDCGCPSIDFSSDDDLNISSRIIVDFYGESPEGIPVGGILWAAGESLSSLEIYSLPDAEHYSLPSLDSLHLG